MPPRARRGSSPAPPTPSREPLVAPAGAVPPGPAPTPRDVGRAVRRLRVAAGWSQEAFADHCGIHRTGMSALERGLTDPKLSSLGRIAAGLELVVSDLLREVEREAASPSP